MTTIAARAAGRTLTAVMAAVLTAGGIFLAASQGRAAEPDRLSGGNRYATAAAIAQASFPHGVSDVVLATGTNFPDALAASGIAGALDAAILLTGPGALPPETAAALASLGARTVHIVGGTAAVTEEVEGAVKAAGYGTRRLAGGDRYATAARIAMAIGRERIAESTAIIATGTDFPDALAAGPLAYAGPHPILLVGNGVPEATNEALVDLGITDIIILGGTAAVSAAVADDLTDITGDDDPIRLGGRTRSETAVQIADHAMTHAGFATSTILLAGGLRPAGVDALAGAVHGGELKAPILPVATDTLPDGTRDFLVNNAADITVIRALGGQAAVSDETLSAAIAAATSDVDRVGPTATSGEVAIGDREWTITFSEPIDPSSLTCDDISVPNQSERCTDIVLDDGDTVATVIFNSSLGGDEMLTLAAGSVTDVVGNPGPQQPLVKPLPPHLADAVLSGPTSVTLSYSQCVTTSGGAPPDAAEFAYDLDGIAGGDTPAIGAALTTGATSCPSGSSTALTLEFFESVLPELGTTLPDDAIRYVDSDVARDVTDIVSGTGLAVPNEAEPLD